MSNQNSEIQSAYALGQTTLQHAGNLPFVVAADGEVHKFPEALERPLQLEQRVQLHTAKDLVSYVNRFADKDSIIFVQVLQGKVRAVLDYHQQTEVAEYGSNANQRLCKHIADFTVEQTPEFQKIKAASGKAMSQTDFALFLEDVMPFINQPAAAELYEIVQSLQAKTNVDFKSAVRTDNGQISIGYSETIEATAGRNGNLAIPEQIVFGIQVHRGGSHYALPARFRYRVKDGNLTLWYDLDQLEKAIEKSMEDTVNYIRAGKPESIGESGEVTEAAQPGVHQFVTILEGTFSA